MQRADYLASSEFGVRRTTRFFIVLLRDRKDGGPTRLGITVTRKVGGAVRRNRIKRLAREWFRSRSREFGSCDLVLIAKRDLPQSLRLANLCQDLDQKLVPAAFAAPQAPS
jgi:ribonuclease P protein component